MTVILGAGLPAAAASTAARMGLTSVCGTNTNALVLHWNGTAWTTSSG